MAVTIAGGFADALRAIQDYERPTFGDTTIYQTRVPATVDAALRRIMADRGITSSQVIRLAIMALLIAETNGTDHAQSSE